MKHRPTNLVPRAIRWISSILLTAFLFPGPLQGGENARAAAVAEDLTDSGRADDRLSPAAFANPPVDVRPGSFWDWLNGSITPGQITRDLEAMKQAGRRLGLAWLPPYRIEISGVARSAANHLEIRIANLWANRLNGDSLLPEAERFTRSNLDRLQTDPTSDSSYGRVPGGKTRPVYTKLPPLMRSGLIGPVRVIAPRD